MATTAYKTPSTFLPQETAANPYYDKVDNLWGAVHEDPVLDDIAECVAMFIGPSGEFDEAAYLAYVEQHFGGALDELIDVFEEQPEVEPAMPPAPSPKLLYNRVADVKIVDVGSGDCNKLSKCQAQVTAIDIEPVENKHYKVEYVDAEVGLRDFLVDKQDSVLTSFNTLTQLLDTTQVEEVDGIHIFPDMNVVRSISSIGEDSVGKYYGDYKDRDNGLVGDVVCDGYVALSMYEQRRVRYAVSDPIVIRNPPHVQIHTSPYKPVDVVVTPKYDGKCMFLMGGATPRLCYRSGRGFKLIDTGQTKKLQMVLMLEKLPKRGKPERFVLLRVMMYRDYYPFHGLESLRRFAKAVNLRIGGARVYAPGDPLLEGYATDGEIFRANQLDYRFKISHTIDICNAHEFVDKLERAYGFDISVDDPREELSEYRISHLDGRFKLLYVGPRTDKTSPTSVEAAAEIFSWVQ